MLQSFFGRLIANSNGGTYTSKVRSESVEKYLNYLYTQAMENPLTPEARIKELLQLPNELLIYLVVEIEKVKSEDNCFAYEKREPGCIQAFFTTFAHVLQNIHDFNFCEDEIKTIHKGLTDPQFVFMFQITPETSGQYRNDHSVETLSLAEFNVSGLHNVIEMMLQPSFQSLRLYPHNLFFKERKCSVDRESGHLFIQFLENLQQIDTSTNNKLLEFFLTRRKLITVDADFLTNFRILLTNNLDHYLILHPSGHDLITDLKAANEDTEFFEVLKRPIYKSVIQLTIQHIREVNDQLEAEINEYKKHTLNYHNIASSRKNTQAIAKTFYTDLKNQKEDLLIQFISEDIGSNMRQKLAETQATLLSMQNKCEDEKLRFIAKTICDFVFIHPFQDANNRVFVNILANMMLVKLGFPFAVFYDPFIFYTQSLDELVDGIKVACSNYLVLCDDISHRKMIFDLEPKFSAEEKLKLNGFLKDFRYELSNTLPSPSARI